MLLTGLLPSLSDKELQDRISKSRNMLMFHTQMGHHDRVIEMQSIVDLLEQESYNRLTNKDPTLLGKKKKKKSKFNTEEKNTTSLEFGELQIGNIDDKPEW